ncbi:MAG: NTP transferase domain-containing protein [Thaumarchaeota archaeon]|nr:NTP transferase domain-containing protein [Nitrososphaerota archaeon]
MIALIMAGGKGTRMNNKGEKLLLKYSKPLILYVVDAMKKSNCFSKIIAATSKHAPQTRSLLSNHDIEIFDTPGLSYVSDLNLFLKCYQTDYIFVVPGDMPLLDKQIIKKIITLHDPSNAWTSYLVTNNFLAKFQTSNIYHIIFNDEKYFFTGLSIVNPRKIKDLHYINENYIILNDRRLLTNINTYQDYQSLLPVTFP